MEMVELQGFCFDTIHVRTTPHPQLSSPNNLPLGVVLKLFSVGLICFYPFELLFASSYSSRADHGLL
jgi:hypothetical protein